MRRHGPHFLRDDGKPAGDVTFARQQNGCLRSEQLLPDEEFTVTASCASYQSTSETLRLPEKAVKELTMHLKKMSAR